MSFKAWISIQYNTRNSQTRSKHSPWLLPCGAAVAATRVVRFWERETRCGARARHSPLPTKWVETLWNACFGKMKRRRFMKNKNKKKACLTRPVRKFKFKFWEKHQRTSSHFPPKMASQNPAEEENSNRHWSLEDFEVGKPLGRGKFGRVFVAREVKVRFLILTLFPFPMFFFYDSSNYMQN